MSTGSMVEAALKEAEAAYPKSGVNLVEIDEFAMPGNALTVVQHFDGDDAAEEAEKRKSELQRKNPHAVYYLYAAK